MVVYASMHFSQDECEAAAKDFMLPCVEEARFASASWATTDSYDWCGEFKEK